MNAPLPERVLAECYAEPVTGWPMLGAGLVWPAGTPPQTLEVELRLDGSPRVQAPLTLAEAGTAFGLHVPREPGAARLQVLLRGTFGEATAFDGAISDMPMRGATMTPPDAPVSRWKGPIRTFTRSVGTGEAFTQAWWQARIRRYQDRVRRLRRRLGDRRLLRGRFRARSPYDAYRENHDPTAADLAAMAAAAIRFRTRPRFSLLCPVYNVAPEWLAAMVASVQAQVYPDWELCLADDASTDPATRAALDKLPADPRIKLVRRPGNGHICAATNSAADLATGDFVALIDHDDRLAPHALFRYAERLQGRPDADLLYSDEDKIRPDGGRFDPQFKPDWSPELLLAYNYVNHLTCVRRTLFERVGRFREGFEGSQDHDLLLRVAEKTDRVEHVAEVLYHWRTSKDSTAGDAGVKPYMHVAGRKAVAEALERRRVAAGLEQPAFAQALNLPILTLSPAAADLPARVAVIVYGEPAAAAKTLQAVKRTTAHASLTTYLVLDDAAAPAEALNRIAAGRDEDYLLFLAAGLEPAEPTWLSALLAHARLPEVGAAGALVTDADGRIVAAGTAGQTPPRAAFAGLKPEPVSYYFLAEVSRPVLAPSPGCLLTRRDLFDRLGGFDADRFGRTLYDVDYSLRLAGAGFRTLHVGAARLVTTSATAGRRDAPTELAHLPRGTDPYANPNLSARGDFAVDPDPPPLAHDALADSLRGLPVLFATHNLALGEGAPKVLAEIATGLAAGYQVRPSFASPRPGPGEEALRKQGVPVTVTDAAFAPRFLDGQWSPAEYDAVQRHLARVLRGQKPAVVVANTVGMFPWVEAAARAGVPALWLIQESYPERLFDALFSDYGRWRAARAFAFADRVVFTSDDCLDCYARFNTRSNFARVRYTLDAAPLEAYRATHTRAESAAEVARLVPPPAGGAPPRFNAVAVGTVCERKSQHTLVEAAAILAKSRRDFAFYLVGAREGLPYLSYVRNLIAARGVGDLVRLVPETPRVAPFLHAADVFVCASYVEAYSLSVLEAQAFELPVVSTPCGGLNEQVAWGQNGLRFDFADAGQLAAHLAALFGRPELLRRLGGESRAAFDAQPPAAAMADRFAQLVAAARRPRPHQDAPR